MYSCVRCFLFAVHIKVAIDFRLFELLSRLEDSTNQRYSCTPWDDTLYARLASWGLTPLVSYEADKMRKLVSVLKLSCCRAAPSFVTALCVRRHLILHPFQESWILQRLVDFQLILMTRSFYHFFTISVSRVPTDSEIVAYTSCFERCSSFYDNDVLLSLQKTRMDSANIKDAFRRICEHSSTKRVA